MGSEIEYRRAAFVQEADPKEGRYFDHFWLFVESGPSNCYEVATGKRSRAWNFVDKGSRDVVLGTVCRNAAYCESGMLKVRGRFTKPENYIKLWRKTIEEEARPVEELTKVLPVRYVRLYLVTEDDVRACREATAHEEELHEKVISDESWQRAESYYGHPYLWKRITDVGVLEEWDRYRKLPTISSSSVTKFN